MTIRDFKSQFRLVYKPSTRLTKIAVCAAVALSAVTLLVLHSATLDARAQADAWRAKAQQLEQENSRLESQIENLGSAESVEDIANNELGLTDPDTVVIEPQD